MLDLTSDAGARCGVAFVTHRREHSNKPHNPLSRTWERFVFVRDVFGAIALMLAFASGAMAQTRGWLYVEGGITGRSQEDVPLVAPSFQVPTTSDAPQANRMGLTGTLGVWVTQHIGVEGEISRTGTQSLDWLYDYAFDETDTERTLTRDVPVIGLVRVAILPERRVDINPVIGGGLTWHHALSYPTADCGYGFAQPPCKPLTTSVSPDDYASFEPALEFGADVRIRVASRFSIVPTVRILKIDRRQWLTGFDHRGPQGGSGTVVVVGCSAGWSNR